MLTLSQLKTLPPKTIFAKGEVENSPEGIYMTDVRRGDMMKWVAVRGGIHDWTIYIHWAEMSHDWVQQHGDKVMSGTNVKKLIECDGEAYAMYRF